MATPHTRNIIPLLVISAAPASSGRSHGYIFCLLPFVILMLGVPCG
jgi:hypothetical protein